VNIRGEVAGTYYDLNSGDAQAFISTPCSASFHSDPIAASKMRRGSVGMAVGRAACFKLAGIRRWTKAVRFGDIEGVRPRRPHLHDLIAYLEANRSGLVNHCERWRQGDPISTAF